MTKYKLLIEFLSDWRVGSGLGDGAAADAVINRDADGLPFIPGRAIKGALRESAWRLALGRGELAPVENFLFGGSSENADGGEWEPDAERSSRSGKMLVGQGRLPADLRAWLLSQEPRERDLFVGDMTVIRRQISLDEDGQTVSGSLRAMECGVPGMSFECEIDVDWPDDSQWGGAYLNALCAGVKSIGADRSRGLGRCRVSVVGAPRERVKYPSAPPSSLAGDLK